jgi:hypothetical protein
MWYIIFKFRKYLNYETLGMFKYMVQHIFLILRKIFKIRKYSIYILEMVKSLKML